MKAITTEDKITIMQASVDGKKIYFKKKSSCDLEWRGSVNPTWDWVKNDYMVDELDRLKRIEELNKRINQTEQKEK